MIDRKNEVAMVALSLEQSAMTKLIEAAERRASQRCQEYDGENLYWKKVDDLLADQDKLMTKIRSFNNDVIMQKPSAFGVSDFLNNSSPTKKRKATEVEVIDTVDGADDGSDSSSSAITVTKVSKK